MSENSTSRGRPRTWSDAAARKRAHQQRQREKLQLIDDLLHAVRNARWDDPTLHRRIQAGDDAQVLQALIEHYRERHWCRVASKRASQPVGPGPEEGSPAMQE